MRCKICDWDIQQYFPSQFPDEDLCEVCEAIILSTMAEQQEDEEEDEEQL